MTAEPQQTPDDKIKNKRIRNKEGAMPIEVMILTPDHEIQGIIYVSRDVQENRRISELLNDADRRFLAVTDAQLVARTGPSTPRMYTFLQVQIHNIIMIHPSVQAVVRKGDYSNDEAKKFNHLRTRLSKNSA